MSTTTVVHALTCPVCGSHAVEPTVREWANCKACGKGMMIADAMGCDCWGYECVPTTTPEPEEPEFEPGTEYPFSISDIARTATARLGDGWACESWPWGVGAYIDHAEHGSFCVGVDEDGDFGVRLDQSKLTPEFCSGSAADGLDACTEWLVEAIRRLIAAATS